MYFNLSYLPLNLLLIPELMLAPGIASSSESLSWPHRTEFVDSYLKLRKFALPLSHGDSRFSRFFDNILSSILQSLTGIDYRKSLIADRMLWELSGSSSGAVFGISATTQTLSHTVYTLWIWYSGSHCTYFGTFQLWLPGVDKFTYCQMLNKLKKAKVIRPYVPLFGSSRASTLLRVLSCRNSIKRNSGLYKAGHGENWYGIGNLIGRSNILTSSDPLTMRRL